MRLSIISIIALFSVSSVHVSGFASIASHHSKSSKSKKSVFKSKSTTTILKAEGDVYTGGVHHTAIRSKDIENAIKFYSLLSFDVEEKFLIGGTVRCAWLKNVHSPCRIELIEIPEDMLGAPKELVRAADQLKKTSLLGLNHMCLDVSQSIKARQALKVSDDDLNAGKLCCRQVALQELFLRKVFFNLQNHRFFNLFRVSSLRNYAIFFC